MTEHSAANNLGVIFDAHVKAEFVDKSVAATMATMVPEPYLTHVPTLTGGTGRVEVEGFYRDHVLSVEHASTMTNRTIPRLDTDQQFIRFGSVA